jgi:hypothetical protein
MSDSKSAERFSVLRAAPEPRLKEIPADEAVDIAKAAFYEARRVQMDLLGLYLNHMLFDPKMVTYQRLRGLRTEARKQVQQAQRVEQLIGDAIEAFKSTAPRREVDPE